MGKELFKNIPSKVGDLVKDVRNGRIGLPDLQRPFVWRDNKVRELLDSMLKGILRCGSLRPIMKAKRAPSETIPKLMRNPKNWLLMANSA